MPSSSFSGRRLHATVALLLVALMCLALWTSYKVLYSRLVAETEQTSLERLRFVASTVEHEPDLMRGNLLMKIAREQGVRLSYIDASGHVVGDSAVPEADVAKLDNHKDRLEFILASQNGFGSAVRTSATLDAETVYTMLRLKDGSYLRIAVPFTAVTTSIRGHFLVLFCAALGLLVPTALIFFSERRAFRNDLRELSGAVGAIAQGNFKRLVSSLGRRELQPLAEDINSMSRTIQKALAEAGDKSCQLQTVFDSIKEGVAIFDGTGAIKTHNAGFLRFFPECKVEERPQAISCIPIPRLQMSIERMLEGAEPEQSGFRAVGLHGEQLLLSLYAPSLPIPDIGAVLIVQDITKLMQLERAQIDFVANVSHELRTPLTAIKGYAEALSEKRYSEEEGRLFARKIERHAGMLHSLVEELMSLAALDAPSAEAEAENTTLWDCAQAARRLVLESGGCGREILVLGDAACPVRTNKALLVQAVRNVVENACAYAPENTPVTVSIEREAGFCRLSVADQGPGIPKEAQRRIFERFYRLEKQRTGAHSGLGLAIAKQIVERFGGSLRVESPAKNAATAFHLQLPSAKAESK